ncbi:MAG: hypothetical protein IH987_12145 [Planctomycetes bacterium]|nr:hypothetical protein [Planctomycetota bacterium]
MQKLKVLITVKTYPIPSSKYDELVCTAGVTEDGDFIRLYPINFRDLPYSKQYKKYQWIEVMAEKHRGRDARKESYRPDSETLTILGEPIPTKPGDWSERAKYALANKAQSLEELIDRQKDDRTSLGIFRPKKIRDLVIERTDSQWNPRFLEALKQSRLWEDRKVTKQPPRKVPFKFSYRFECDDERCKGNHKMMIEDWEVGALYWRLIDKGANPDEAAAKVQAKFLDDLCGPNKDTHFYVGTILAHPKSWVVIGVFYPKKTTVKKRTQKKTTGDMNLRLFDDN